jgi:putative flippase GtrA
VRADSDGQHMVSDVARGALAVRGAATGIVLGSRRFDGLVPLRSRLGNDVTRIVVRLVTGRRPVDTQTGLRGYPAAMLDWLTTIDGDRFQYELAVLLAAHRAGFEFHQVPITTLYLEHNASSHVRPVRDSIRVDVPIVVFAMSSLTAFLIDVALFFALMTATGSLATSVVAARVVSASVNFAINHRIVFAERPRHPASAAARYVALVAALMVANYVLLRVLTGPVGLGVVVAKLVTELTLFIASYHVQRRVVFPSGSRSQGRGALSTLVS